MFRLLLMVELFQGESRKRRDESDGEIGEIGEIGFEVLATA